MTSTLINASKQTTSTQSAVDPQSAIFYAPNQVSHHDQLSYSSSSIGFELPKRIIINYEAILITLTPNYDVYSARVYRVINLK